MTFEGRPEEVQKARLSGDSETLSHMGKKGAEAKRERKRQRALILAEQLARDARNHAIENDREHYRISEEGDVLPPDPK